MMGVAVPLPVLDETVVAHCAVQDQDIVAPIVDFAIPRRIRPTFGLVSYAQLKSGRINIDGKLVRVAPLASLYLSRQIALELKNRIQAGQFLLSQAVAAIPNDRAFIPQDIRGR
jgi:uncharacterized protein (DUF39 family)